jgi:Protein of unknown function (DUF2922).
MSQKLQMTFVLAGGKTFTFSLANPKSDLTKAEVTTVMTQIIDKKAVLTTSGYPLGIKETLIRSTEETALA